MSKKTDMHFSDDTIIGDDFRIDVIYGDTSGDIAAGRGGNDLIFGRGGSFGRGQGDALYGDAENLRGTARGGDDLIDGGEGNDLLSGDATFLADNGRGGDDRLDGGAGNDALWGDAQFLTENAAGGRDTFVFAGVFGDDQVLDFRRGEDRIEFAVQDRDPSDLQITSDASGTVITLEGFGSVTLVGYTGGLSGSDVFFV